MCKTKTPWGDIREKLKGKPELDLKNKNVCITGKIELYKASPQIVIRNVEQLKLQRGLIGESFLLSYFLEPAGHFIFPYIIPDKIAASPLIR